MRPFDPCPAFERRLNRRIFIHVASDRIYLEAREALLLQTHVDGRQVPWFHAMYILWWMEGTTNQVPCFPAVPRALPEREQFLPPLKRVAQLVLDGRGYPWSLRSSLDE